MPRTLFAPTAIVFAGLLLAPGAASTASAQTTDAESVKALRELVAEVRGLRAVIEQYANAQIQSQAVGELLSVQQRRVSDVTMRLDSVRQGLDGSVSETRRMTDGVAKLEESLRRVSDPKERLEIDLQLGAMRSELERKTAEEQGLRGRETELLNSLGLEEAKWNELVDRLNQWLRR